MIYFAIMLSQYFILLAADENQGLGSIRHGFLQSKVFQIILGCDLFQKFFSNFVIFHVEYRHEFFQIAAQSRNINPIYSRIGSYEKTKCLHRKAHSFSGFEDVCS